MKVRVSLEHVPIIPVVAAGLAVGGALNLFAWWLRKIDDAIAGADYSPHEQR